MSFSLESRAVALLRPLLCKDITVSTPHSPENLRERIISVMRTLFLQLVEDFDLILSRQLLMVSCEVSLVFEGLDVHRTPTGY